MIKNKETNNKNAFLLFVKKIEKKKLLSSTLDEKIDSKIEKMESARGTIVPRALSFSFSPASPQHKRPLRRRDGFPA